MKKAIILSAMMALLSSHAFAEFQIGSSFGWFWERNTYEGDMSRSFHGLDVEIKARYFFIENVGLFFGVGSQSWFSSNNDDFLSELQTLDGVNFNDTSTFGVKLNLSFGLALKFPVTENWDIQSDIGVFWNPWGIETISGDMRVMGVDVPMNMYIDPMSGFGFTGSIFGSHNIMPNTNLIFGLRFDLGITRNETVEVRALGTSVRDSGSPDFLGFSIAPFIGIMGRF